MNAQKIDMFLMANSSNLPEEKLVFLREHLEKLDESKWAMLSAIQFKNPITSLILSIFFGSLGVDRFYLGDGGIGVGKLLTCGGFGLWWLIDCFLIMKATREKKTLFKILCKWKQDSAVSLSLYLDSVFKNKHKLIHNQAPV